MLNIFNIFEVFNSGVRNVFVFLGEARKFFSAIFIYQMPSKVIDERELQPHTNGLESLKRLQRFS